MTAPRGIFRTEYLRVNEFLNVVKRFRNGIHKSCPVCYEVDRRSDKNKDSDCPFKSRHGKIHPCYSEVIPRCQDFVNAQTGLANDLEKAIRALETLREYVAEDWFK
jgi:hypothetical protein